MSFLDTLRAAFKGGGGARVPLARSFTSPWTWAFEPAGTRPPFEYRNAVRHAFLENPVAQRAVRIVAEGVGSAPLLPSDADDSGRALALVGATSAGQSLFETLAAQLLLHGNGYVQVMRDGGGEPIELYALRPERVSVVAGPDGWPAAYQYKVGDKAITLNVEDDDGWPQVIHLKGFHPSDDHCRAGAKGILRQRGPRADRRAVASGRRGRGRRATGKPGRGRMLAGRRNAERGMGRPCRRAGLIPGRRLDLCGTARRASHARQIDRAGGPLPRRLGASGNSGAACWRCDGGHRGASRNRRPDRRTRSRRVPGRKLTAELSAPCHVPVPYQLRSPP